MSSATRSPRSAPSTTSRPPGRTAASDEPQVPTGSRTTSKPLPLRPRSRLVVTPPQRRQHQDLVVGLDVDAGAVGTGDVRQRRAVLALPDQHVVPVEAEALRYTTDHSR